MTLDTPAEAALSHGNNETDASLDSASSSCHGRWYCAWTHPTREHQAAREIASLGFQTYLPLCLTRRATDRRAIVPLFPRYLFLVIGPSDPWGEILRHAGRTTTGAVAGIIRHAPSSPTPVPIGVVEHLMSRTSARGVVDDPGDIPTRIPPGAAVSVLDGPMAGLAGIVTMSSAARCHVLIALLGRHVSVSVEPHHLTAS